MDGLITSTLVVTVAEIGDKTQLLAFMLACRFRRPLPIALGILAATLANHAAAAGLGVWVQGIIPPDLLRWLLAASFVAMAAWALIPDKLDAEAAPKAGSAGPFLTTLAAFFLVEIGDKTQVATVALAMRFEAMAMVVIGTTAGMLVANLPVVVLGGRAASKLPLKTVRIVAALMFVGLGLAVLIRPGLVP
jgi:putative Ca2+/H+ antiporter (TMEM165/GDT1 family)